MRACCLRRCGRILRVPVSAITRVSAVGQTDIEGHCRVSKIADLEDQRSSCRPRCSIQQEFVMSAPKKKYDPRHDDNQDQEQDQDQKQDQLQAQANLQAQLQGQGQGQGQGQLQFAVQSLDSKSEN